MLCPQCDDGRHEQHQRAVNYGAPMHSRRPCTCPYCTRTPERRNPR